MKIAILFGMSLAAAVAFGNVLEFGAEMGFWPEPRATIEVVEPER